jgi:hypothetical protein
LLLLPAIKRHGPVNGFLMVRKDQFEGHLLDVPGHVASAIGLNLTALDVGSLILKVQQQPKLETGIRNGHFDAVRLGLLFGIE